MWCGSTHVICSWWRQSVWLRSTSVCNSMLGMSCVPQVYYVGSRLLRNMFRYSRLLPDVEVMPKKWPLCLCYCTLIGLGLCPCHVHNSENHVRHSVDRGYGSENGTELLKLYGGLYTATSSEDSASEWPVINRRRRRRRSWSIRMTRIDKSFRGNNIISSYHSYHNSVRDW